MGEWYLRSEWSRARQGGVRDLDKKVAKDRVENARPKLKRSNTIGTIYTDMAFPATRFWQLSTHVRMRASELLLLPQRGEMGPAHRSRERGTDQVSSRLRMNTNTEML